MEPSGVEMTKQTARGWLQTHLEEFVKPVLGFIPTTGKDDTHFFSSQEMTIIKNMWRSVKREARRTGKPLLLAGRDVFVWEVLARRENFPTVFRPEISRLTASHITEDYSKHFLFDTGFMGSIPSALRCKSFTMGSSNVVGATLYRVPWRRQHELLKTDPRQVFPRMKGARSLILKIERTPKYWRRGYWRGRCECEYPVWGRLDLPYENPNRCISCNLWRNVDMGVQQEFSDMKEFEEAAKLTIQIYKDSSPSFEAGQINIVGLGIGVGYLE